jgi:hypothetical protein
MTFLNKLSILPNEDDIRKIWKEILESSTSVLFWSVEDFIFCGASWVNNRISSEVQALRAYSIEIHNHPETLTIHKLIDAHRILRNLRLDTQEGYRAEMKLGYEHGRAQAIAELKGDTVQLSELKTMTMQEITNLIGEDQ